MESFILDCLKLTNYRSFAELELELRPINVLIGANGSGKSNLIRWFELCQRLMSESLQHYVSECGGPDQILHYGRKRSPHLRIHLRSRRQDYPLAHEYECVLVPAENRLLIKSELVRFHHCSLYDEPYQKTACCPEGLLVPESTIPSIARTAPRSVEAWVWKALHSWRIYHFHDTTPGARLKRLGRIQDNMFLQSDAGNLAAFLYYLREQHPFHITGF